MSRLLSLLLVFLLLVPAALAEDVLTIQIPVATPEKVEEVVDTPIRSWDKEAGWQYLQVGEYMYEKDGAMAPVLWRVLFVEDNKALMITEYVIDLCQPYPMDNKKDYDYYKEYKHKSRLPKLESVEETEMPQWFATVMYPVLIGEDPIGEAFVDSGSGKLFTMPTEEWARTDYGFTKKNSTLPNKSRIAQVTPYVKDKKMYDWSTKMTTYEDGYVGSCYWTSTMRPGERRLQIVGINGHLSWAGWIRPNVGVRPAARLDLTKVEVVSGSGEVNDPFILRYAGSTVD